MQFVFARGISDMDDLLLNCLGGLIGILGYKGLMLFLRSEEKAKTTVVVCATIICVPIILFLIFRVIERIIVRGF